MQRYHVKNEFILRGELIKSGSEVELTDDEAEQLKPKDVLGKPVKAVEKGKQGGGEQ